MEQALALAEARHAGAVVSGVSRSMILICVNAAGDVRKDHFRRLVSLLLRCEAFLKDCWCSFSCRVVVTAEEAPYVILETSMGKIVVELSVPSVLLPKRVTLYFVARHAH